MSRGGRRPTIALDVGGRRVTIGAGQDFDHDEVAILRGQMRRLAAFPDSWTVPDKIPPDVVHAILDIKAVFPGAVVADFYEPTVAKAPPPAPPEADRYRADPGWRERRRRRRAG